MEKTFLGRKNSLRQDVGRILVGIVIHEDLDLKVVFFGGGCPGIPVGSGILNNALQKYPVFRPLDKRRLKETLAHILVSLEQLQIGDGLGVLEELLIEVFLIIESIFVVEIPEK